MIICAHVRSGKALRIAHLHVAAEQERCDAPPSCSSSRLVNQSFPWSLVYLVSCVLGVFFCISLVISLFKRAPTCSAAKLSSVPKCKKAMTCLMEKVYVRQASFRHEVVLLTTDSTLMNQQSILNKVASNRNTYNIKLYID